MNNNELYHYGRLGQKWGLRLYQNKDGSLTALGRQRYGTKTNFERVQRAKRAADPNRLKKLKKRAAQNERTQAEIDKYIKQKEDYLNSKGTKPKETKPKVESSNSSPVQQNQNYGSTKVSDVNPKTVATGKRFANWAINKVLIPAITDVAKETAKKEIKKMVDNMLYDDANTGNNKRKKKDNG